MRKPVSILAVLAIAPFALAACGSSNDSGTSATTTPTADTQTQASTTDEDTGGEAQSSAGSSSSAGDAGTVKISADPSGALKFEQTNVTAKAGSNTIELVNDSPVPHNLNVEAASGDPDIGTVPELSQDSGSFTADLKPGKYVFYCSLPGHREAGMEGTITVK